jgi:hypothetical protein
VKLSTAVNGLLIALLLGAVGGWMAFAGQDINQRIEQEWAPATLFSDGEWIVGEDVAAGVYVIDAKAGPDCVYASPTQGGVDLAEPRADGRTAILLAEGEVISTQYCGIWRKA